MKNHPTNNLLDSHLSFSNEEALGFILNNLDEVFMLVDRELHIIHTTEQTKEDVQKNFGIAITSKTNVLELVVPERRQFMVDIYRDVFEGKERETIVELKRDGEPVIFETHFKPARSNSGEIVCALVIAKDITKQKKAENSLKLTEERWRFALEGGNQGVWDWNVASGDIYFSDSYKKLYGYAPDDLNGRIEEWETMIHPDDRKRMSQSVDSHFTSVDPYYESIYRVKTKEGNYKWILGRGMLIRNDDGKPLRMIGTHTDITKQITAEQTYKVLFYSNPLPMWTYDINTLRILTVNEAAISHYGYSKEEFLSMTIKDIRPPEDISDLMEWVSKRKDVERIKRASRHLKKNGDVITVELTTHKLEDSTTILVVAQDITDRKYAEQVLSLERSVFELSNKPGTDFLYLAQSLLNGLESIHDDAYTSLLLLKNDGIIDPVVAPRIHEFIRHFSGIKLGPEDGSCGAAISRKETVIVEDINSDVLWQKYKSLALSFGLQSCWAIPIILSSGKVMGAFAIYHKKVKTPSALELNTVERIRNILRILMEHHWSLDEIKKMNERFDNVLKATHDLIWDWNMETNTIFHDEFGLQKVYAIADNRSINTIELWLSHIHPDDLKKVQKNISDILKSSDEDTFDVEYRFRGDDGDYTHVYDRGMIIRNQDGKPVRVIGAAQNITERKNLEEELLRNELEKQKAINQATVDSQEQERTEIGKELHDNVNQILTTTKLYLDLALSNVELKDELIKKSSQNIISVINEIRQLSRSLMDPTIGDLGLIDSINDLIENINLTRKFHVNLEADRVLEDILSNNHKLTIFRILQEALNNAMKHAKATSVHIIFKRQNNRAELIIEDNGVGFEPALVRLGAGLKNIQNRVYLINGTFQIKTASKQGSKMIINFPII